MWIEEYHRNTRRFSRSIWPSELETIFPVANVDRAVRQIRVWPNYAESPLVSLDGLASDLSIANIWYKDESNRFGMGSFKSLGGAYAVSQLLSRVISHRMKQPVGLESCRSGQFSDITREVTVTTATDGNHGRSVAWGAQQFGCRAVIYVHANVSKSRCDTLRHLGAEVCTVSGSYDDAVDQCAQDAEEYNRFLVADTSLVGPDPQVTSDVMAGYGVMVDEIIEQLPTNDRVTYMMIQAGVGGLAAAVAARFWQRLDGDRPRLSIVEPVDAACLLQSAIQHAPAAITLARESLMAGLSCGATSPLAWQIVEPVTDDFMTISDQAVAPVMRELAAGSYGGGPIVAGESAVAGLAALISAIRRPPPESRFGFDGKSNVLVIGTEGATDPVIYQRLVGRRADAVRSGQ